MKYKIIKLIFLIIIILFIASIQTCKKLIDPISNNKFQIFVDSLQVPETINLMDTVNCKFYGFIGSNLCYQFSHFEVEKVSGQIYFKLWGFNTGNEICATAESKLKGKEYKFVAVNRGVLKINVLQPDNTVLKDSVMID